MSIKTIYNVFESPPALVPCSFIFHDTGPWQLLDICRILWPLRFENWFFSLCSFYVTLSLIHAKNRIVGLMEWPVECWDTSLVFRLQEQEQRRFTLHVLATSHVFPETLKKTTSELDISRMFKLRTGARLCSGRGGTIFIRGHSGPSFDSISTHPVSVSDPRVLLWFNRGCNRHKTLRAKAIMWVGLDRSTYGTGTPLRPGSTFIDGFSKCGTPNFKSPPFLHLLMDFQK